MVLAEVAWLASYAAMRSKIGLRARLQRSAARCISHFPLGCLKRNHRNMAFGCHRFSCGQMHVHWAAIHHQVQTRETLAHQTQSTLACWVAVWCSYLMRFSDSGVTGALDNTGMSEAAPALWTACGAGAGPGPPHLLSSHCGKSGVPVHCRCWPCSGAGAQAAASPWAQGSLLGSQVGG